MSQHKRLIIACALSGVILFFWQMFYANPKIEQAKKIAAQKKIEREITSENLNLKQENYVNLDRSEVLNESKNKNTRIKIENENLHGSINLIGARIDDLTLSKYKQAVAPESNEIVLLSPSQTKEVYFTEFGWLSPDKKIDLPNSDTKWHADKDTLKAGEAVTLSWQNTQGINFKIVFSLDEKHMFKVKQIVENHTDTQISFSNYSLINKSQSHERQVNYLLHEGALGFTNQKLEEVTYASLKEKNKISFKDRNTWIGITDKYWLTSIIPVSKFENFDISFNHTIKNKADRYQVDLKTPNYQVKQQESFDFETLFFAGPRKLSLLEEYTNKYQIPFFDRAVDFGALYFITKPIFLLLQFFYGILGNFGLAILLLTVVIKMFLFPLAYKGYKGMNKLKELQPEVLRIREMYKDNKELQSRAMMDVYKKHKVNPVSGCFPILLQMPIFFALYKVLFVAIEMRHAPFFGWIRDLSAQDPTTIFNLFGLIPWTPPTLLIIGVFPILMALTMFLQQKLNPAPVDPVQAKVMTFLPLMFLVLFASFPSGLVIYWAWSNTLSIFQQLIIKKIDKTQKNINEKRK